MLSLSPSLSLSLSIPIPTPIPMGSCPGFGLVLVRFAVFAVPLIVREIGLPDGFDRDKDGLRHKGNAYETIIAVDRGEGCPLRALRFVVGGLFLPATKAGPLRAGVCDALVERSGFRGCPSSMLIHYARPSCGDICACLR